MEIPQVYAVIETDIIELNQPQIVVVDNAMPCLTVKQIWQYTGIDVIGLRYRYCIVKTFYTGGFVLYLIYIVTIFTIKYSPT